MRRAGTLDPAVAGCYRGRRDALGRARRYCRAGGPRSERQERSDARAGASGEGSVSRMVIDADGHVGEPTDLFERYLDVPLGGRKPYMTRDDWGVNRWVI